ncbi:MAG: peptidylprolyl isomerase [Proteobacteria bacterium]|nr:peptidylprolyl isomerase [Pseudomonadota bacterium]
MPVRPRNPVVRPALIAAAAAVCAALPAASPAAPGAMVDGIAAVVGKEIILLSEVVDRSGPVFAELEAMARQGGGKPPLGAQRHEVLREVLESMIDEILVGQQAAEIKLTVSSEEVEAAIANVIRENGVDREVFEREIAKRGMDMLEYRSQMRRDLLKFKVINLKVRGRVKISDTEAREYYNGLVRDVRASGWFEGAHVLVRVPPGARAMEVARAKKRAEEIRARIDAGESFEAVAEGSSDDAATAKRGGGLGVRKPGEIPALDRVFVDLEPGEVSGPLRTPSGFHVVKLLAREELGVQPFADVRQRILNQLVQEEMIRQEKIWLRELKLRTFIDRRPPLYAGRTAP